MVLLNYITVFTGKGVRTTVRKDVAPPRHRALAASGARSAFFTTGSRKLAVVEQADGLQ